jgi:hypothetical protein
MSGCSGPKRLRKLCASLRKTPRARTRKRVDCTGLRHCLRLASSIGRTFFCQTARGHCSQGACCARKRSAVPGFVPRSHQNRTGAEVNFVRKARRKHLRRMPQAKSECRRALEIFLDPGSRTASPSCDEVANRVQVSADAVKTRILSCECHTLLALREEVRDAVSYRGENHAPLRGLNFSRRAGRMKLRTDAHPRAARKTFQQRSDSVPVCIACGHRHASSCGSGTNVCVITRNMPFP